MIVSVLLVGVKLPRVLSRRAGRDNTQGSLTPTRHTQSCLIPIITWCRHFSTATNILLIKSNLNFESRATAVSVAMSPRYLVGKYRSRLHSRSRKVRVLVFAGDWAREIKLRQTWFICFRGDNEVDHAVCLKAEFQMHPALSNENGRFYTTMIYPCFSRSVCFSMGSPDWWRFGLFQAGVPSCPGDVTLRSCTREFQMWRRRCKQIDPHWFQGRQLRFWWMLSTMSWK